MPARIIDSFERKLGQEPLFGERDHLRKGTRGFFSYFSFKTDLAAISFRLFMSCSSICEKGTKMIDAHYIMSERVGKEVNKVLGLSLSPDVK